MKVYFIGAGPGDPELLTLKAARLINEADLVLYAGSLVPHEAVAHAKPSARVLDSSGLTLDQTHALMLETVRAGGMAARVHTGDPSLYGAVREQMHLLDRDGIEYELVPGVSAVFAVAAAAKVSLTIPERCQTLVVSRAAGRTPVAEGGRIRDLAGPGRALAVYLSAGDPAGVAQELIEAGMDPSALVIIGHRVGWPGERVLRSTVATLAADAQGCSRQTVFLVLPAEDGGDSVSKLYDPRFSHGFRP
jgi:precorrin-4/cobalt-precorrin-4 C11-methyltransferase